MPRIGKFIGAESIFMVARDCGTALGVTANLGGVSVWVMTMSWNQKGVVVEHHENTKNHSTVCFKMLELYHMKSLNSFFFS